MYYIRFTDVYGHRVAHFRGRGFACTSEELPKEIERVGRSLGAAGNVSYTYCPDRDVFTALAEASGRKII